MYGAEVSFAVERHGDVKQQWAVSGGQWAVSSQLSVISQTGTTGGIIHESHEITRSQTAESRRWRSERGQARLPNL